LSRRFIASWGNFVVDFGGALVYKGGAMTATNTSTHYSADDTAPICGGKSKKVSHYLSEISCLRCGLVLRSMGLEWLGKKKKRRR
jgi:hypothetical protein